MDLFDTPSPHPTVHVFGKADEFYDYGRDGFGYKPQEEPTKSYEPISHSFERLEDIRGDGEL